MFINEVNIWIIGELLKDNQQRRIFDFLFDNSASLNNDAPGFNKIVLGSQSFRDERTKIDFPNGASGYRIEMNDEITEKNKQPTVVFYFLDNAETHFRLQEPTIEGEIVSENGFDYIKGISATNIPEKDLDSVTRAMRINENVLISNKYPNALLISPISEMGVISLQLNSGNKNRIIHGKVTMI